MLKSLCFPDLLKSLPYSSKYSDIARRDGQNTNMAKFSNHRVPQILYRIFTLVNKGKTNSLKYRLIRACWVQKVLASMPMPLLGLLA